MNSLPFTTAPHVPYVCFIFFSLKTRILNVQHFQSESVKHMSCELGQSSGRHPALQTAWYAGRAVTAPIQYRTPSKKQRSKTVRLLCARVQAIRDVQHTLPEKTQLGSVFMLLVRCQVLRRGGLPLGPGGIVPLLSIAPVKSLGTTATLKSKPFPIVRVA